MKIAFVVGEFPKVSKTFVLNQINGLIDRGHEVDILADRPWDHLDEEKSDFLTRIHYPQQEKTGCDGSPRL